MRLTLTWYGHNCWQLQDERHTLLIDPFLSGSPTAPVKPADVSPDFILLSHGHGDHVGDTIEIAQRTGAAVISNYEICSWLAAQGVKNTSGGNLGGWQSHAFGRVKSTLAFHSSVLPDGANGGNPGGFLFEIDGRRLYFACDTALFSDMQLLAAGGLDLAVLPIGDFFTMGPDDALQAVHWLKPKQVVPCHYGTFPPIDQDPAAWAARVKNETSSVAIVLKPGESIEL
jgi:L-ascorbate metabolism protein UlaG (beta-lactamase superfamily)